MLQTRIDAGAAQHTQRAHQTSTVHGPNGKTLSQKRPQRMWRKSCIQSWPHDFSSFSFSWMSHSFPNHVEIDWFSLSILSNTEAYSTGWKLAKKLFPDQAEKWSSEGVKVRQEKLEELRAKGIQAAKDFKCARHFALQHVVFLCIIMWSSSPSPTSFCKPGSCLEQTWFTLDQSLTYYLYI